MKTVYTLVLCFLCALVLTGCMPQYKIVNLSTTLSQEEIAQHKNAIGKNTIKGSALVRRQGGGVVTCAGLDIKIVPVTHYTTERMVAVYGSSNKGFYYINNPGIYFLPDNPAYKEIEKISQCDAQGFFKFENVPDGDYFVTSSIVWHIPQGQYFSLAQGGTMMQAVTVHGGETKEIVLAP